MNFTRYYNLLWAHFLPVVFLICASASHAGASPPESVAYRETTGEEIVDFTWKLNRPPDGNIDLEVIRPEERFFNRFDPAGEILRWGHTAPGRDITAHRTGNRILLTGSLDGQEIEKTWTIDSAPWYQALSFCLRPFLRSERREIEFWMIRPDTVNAVKLRAEKTAKESITLYGRQFEAWHVTVRRTGFLSVFWHGDYWYRLEDGLFLKYRGVHGPPGTAETVVEADL